MFLFNKVVEIGGAPGEHAFLLQMLGIFAGIMVLGFYPGSTSLRRRNFLELFEQRGNART